MDIKLKGKLKDISEKGARIYFDEEIKNYPEKQKIT